MKQIHTKGGEIHESEVHRLPEANPLAVVSSAKEFDVSNYSDIEIEARKAAIAKKAAKKAANKQSPKEAKVEETAVVTPEVKEEVPSTITEAEKLEMASESTETVVVPEANSEVAPEASAKEEAPTTAPEPPVSATAPEAKPQEVAKAAPAKASPRVGANTLKAEWRSKVIKALHPEDLGCVLKNTGWFIFKLKGSGKGRTLGEMETKVLAHFKDAKIVAKREEPGGWHLIGFRIPEFDKALGFTADAIAAVDYGMPQKLIDRAKREAEPKTVKNAKGEKVVKGAPDPVIDAEVDAELAEARKKAAEVVAAQAAANEAAVAQKLAA